MLAAMRQSVKARNPGDHLVFCDVHLIGQGFHRMLDSPAVHVSSYTKAHSSDASRADFSMKVSIAPNAAPMAVAPST